ncbi:hypothetical protein [Streptomyces sp. XD-27]|uniref:hypothetical protein n=1 Tax=Streptomyces sp. XD-27 TaxID=3062779 RepID=UPI0026F43EF9|nr:hypothetical protein [Streptomyces sp. XD-27]WKX70472.1 hypothetical protein Q3Y56_11540 [Streptomyces sp. XD-27]
MNSAIATPPPSRSAGEQNQPLEPVRLAEADLVIEDLTADPWPTPPPGICICTVGDR